MQILETLFPMKSVKRKNWMPLINVVLQKNRTLIENMIGADIEKEIAEKMELELIKV